MRTRCDWAEQHEIFHAYHDEEWGVPVFNDQLLFEMLNLEGAQAGLSWLTILKKREGYRKAFANFDIPTVAQYTEEQKRALLNDSGIVKHQLKIHAVVENAKATLAVQREFGSFHKYLWSFVGGVPCITGGTNASTPECKMLSKHLKKRGYKFVGITTCFAFMQATGMVNDHSPRCFKYRSPLSRA